MMRFLGLIATAFLFASCTPVEGISEEPVIMPVEPDGSIGDGIPRVMLSMFSQDEVEGLIMPLGHCEFIANGNEMPILINIRENSREGFGNAVLKINGTQYFMQHEDFSIVNGHRIDTFISERYFMDMKTEIGGSEDRKSGPAAITIVHDVSGQSNSYAGRYNCD